MKLGREQTERDDKRDRPPSFPGSAWGRIGIQALRAVFSTRGRASVAVRSLAEPGNEEMAGCGAHEVNSQRFAWNPMEIRACRGHGKQINTTAGNGTV